VQFRSITIPSMRIAFASQSQKSLPAFDVCGLRKILSLLEALESAFNHPIRLAFEVLEQQHKTARGENDLDG
jgi:hypothetical protein